MGGSTLPVAAVLTSSFSPHLFSSPPRPRVAPADPLFRGVNFSVDLDSRIALVGPNGAGKSTLVKLILGELEPQAGVVSRNSKLRAACFVSAQERSMFARRPVLSRKPLSSY